MQKTVSKLTNTQVPNFRYRLRIWKAFRHDRHDQSLLVGACMILEFGLENKELLEGKWQLCHFQPI
jgi:hypothetical protein